jgi:uncharacterized protein YhaN
MVSTSESSSPDPPDPNVPDPNAQRLERVEALLEQLIQDFKQDRLELRQETSELRQDLAQFEKRQERFDEKFETYQKATQWVVQLAFSLIAAATVTIIVSSVLGQ